MISLQINTSLETVQGFIVSSCYGEVYYNYTEDTINLGISFWVSRQKKEEGKEPIRFSNQLGNVSPILKNNYLCDTITFKQNELNMVRKHIIDYFKEEGIPEEKITFL